MSEKKIHFLGRAQDLGEPGLDQIEEVKMIIQSIMRDYREGRADIKTTRRRLGALKRLIKKSSMGEIMKGHALNLVKEVEKELKAERKKKK